MIAASPTLLRPRRSSILDPDVTHHRLTPKKNVCPMKPTRRASNEDGNVGLYKIHQADEQHCHKATRPQQQHPAHRNAAECRRSSTPPRFPQRKLSNNSSHDGRSIVMPCFSRRISSVTLDFDLEESFCNDYDDDDYDEATFDESQLHNNNKPLLLANKSPSLLSRTTFWDPPPTASSSARQCEISPPRFPMRKSSMDMSHNKRRTTMPPKLQHEPPTTTTRHHRHSVAAVHHAQNPRPHDDDDDQLRPPLAEESSPSPSPRSRPLGCLPSSTTLPLGKSPPLGGKPSVQESSRQSFKALLMLSPGLKDSLSSKSCSTSAIDRSSRLVQEKLASPRRRRKTAPSIPQNDNGKVSSAYAVMALSKIKTSNTKRSSKTQLDDDDDDCAAAVFMDASLDFDSCDEA